MAVRGLIAAQTASRRLEDPMDPISLSTLVGLITQSAAGQAGKSAWDGLTELTRRAFRHGSSVEVALQQAKAGGPESVLELAGHLVQGAAADPDLADLLRAWIAQVQQVSDGAVNNTISAGARARDVVQARDVGTIHFGGNREYPTG
ncbi:MAG: hypothetical protein ACRDRL_24535 [Sciscionella sp.]